MTSQARDGWEIVSSIATVAAVCVALALAVVPSVWRWIRRPRLAAVVGKREPLVRPKGEGLHLVERLILRIGVENVGHRSARNVMCRLEAWYKFDGNNRPWLRLDVDPVPMRWVALPIASNRGRSAPVVEIPPGTTTYVDAIQIQTQSHRHFVLIDDAETAQFSRECPDYIGTFRLRIIVTADEADSLDQTIEYEIDGKNFFTRVVLADPPPARDTGLIALLNDFVDTDRKAGE